MDGIKLLIDERMARQNIEKVVRGQHTRHERAILRDELRLDDRLMELGGGIGTVAITASRIIGSENVLSFEANPTIEDLIRKNYALNDVSPTLKINLVGEEYGTQTFYVNERFSRSSMIKPEGESRPVPVPVVPFAEELARFKPTFLVVDIQGSEKDFLRYADLSSIRSLLIEFHPSMIGFNEIAKLRKLLRIKHGYKEVRRTSNCYLYKR
jgi:FkbM family methyltransferase